MATMRIAVLVLCVVLALPTNLAQTINCIPLEIGASLLNCSSIDSVYLSCACNVYKASIVEIMGTINCLLPSSMSTDAIQTQVSQLLGMVTTNPTDILKDVINMQPFSLISPAALVVQSSSTGSLEMINLIKNITEKIAEDIFDKLCANVAQLSQCAADPAFISSIKPDDTNLKALFNLNHVGTFITRMCALKNDLYANKNCPSDIIIPIGVCAYLPTIWDSSSTEIPLFSGTVISDTQVNSFCPKMGDLFRCAAIQVAPCNPSLAAMVKSLSTDLLIPTCSNLAMEGAQYPTSSPLLVCAVPHVTKVLPLAVTVESIPGDPTTFQIQELIGDAINIACAILPDYFMCVREELPSSKNRFDMFIKELIDVNQFTYGTAIANLMCDAGRVKAITDMIPCVITKAIDIEACGTAERIMVFDNFNITNLAHDANKDRQEFCGPIKELAMCIFDAILVPCNADVGAFAKEAFYWAMQTDCYGARNGTFQKVIDEQKRNGGTPVAIGNARIYWLGVLLASVLIYRA